MFDPTDEDTAISPSPFRATITDVIKSGIDVPAAKNVRPITCKGGNFQTIIVSSEWAYDMLNPTREVC